MRSFAASANHAQPGDSAKFTEGLMRLATAEDPPLRMPFGNNNVSVIEEQNASVAKERAQWHELAVSTDLSARSSPITSCRPPAMVGVKWSQATNPCQISHLEHFREKGEQNKRHPLRECRATTISCWYLKL